MSILKFEPNTPITVTLRYPKGKHVPNKFNPDEDQVMYSFTDGSVAYFPPIVEKKIEALTPAKGQAITICKSQKNGTTEWQVSSIQKPQLVTKLLDNSDLDEYPEQPPRKPVSTQLANALKTALQAAAWDLLIASKGTLKYMRKQKLADKSWAVDLATAISKAEGRI